MMTEYQRQKLDELIDLLKAAIEISDEGDLRHNSKRLEAVLDVAENIRGNKAETSVDSSIMDAYFEKSLELFHSEDFDIPWVCPIDDKYAYVSMPLDRFVELLAARKKQREEGK